MTTSPFTVYSGANISGLVDSFLGQNSGISIVAGSVTLTASAADAVNFYDATGVLSRLGIGSGLLLTSGTTPGTSNTVDWFGQDNTVYALDGTPANFYNGDPDVDAVVNTVFQTQSYDATTLSFAFNVTDPAATSISFDLVFGTDEYPEWVDQFVDCAVVIVNGVNYAFFNHDPAAPLSVISPNLAAGYFQDNAGNVLPIEYDGVSKVLKIIAPIIPGQENTIKIGVADTGDHIYDSGLFISNMVAGNTPGSGVVITPDKPCTAGDDIVSGTLADELINLLDGNDTAYAGGGDDIVVAGGGNDIVYGGSGNDVLEGDGGDDYLDGGEGSANEADYAGPHDDYQVTFNAATGNYTISGGADGTDTLVNIQLVKFADGLFDLTTGGLVAHTNGGGAPGNAAGALLVVGAAVVGQTLTAVVMDADGLPADAGAISYVWSTSADGVNWTETQVASKAFVVAPGDAGLQVKATASYIDLAGNAEVAESAPLTVAAPQSGLSMALMALAAPSGASVMNPLTTLLDDAMVLGFTANAAAQAVKAVLGLPDINLKSFDPLAALAANPTNANALKVLKACGEVAMIASVSDPSGYNLTLSLMDAAAHGQMLNLADPTVLASLLPGIGATELAIVKTTNHDMADASDLSGIKAAWKDFCGHLDAMHVYENNLGILFEHLNQSPLGTSTASLPFGVVDTAYDIAATVLLTGFSDPDGDPLTVTDLWADSGAVVHNGDGSWTFQPAAGFAGPVELAFTISDPSGASISGSAMLVIAPAPVTNQAPVIASNGGGDTAAVSVAENTAVITTVAASDPDVGASLAYTIVGGADAALFQIAADTGVLTFKSAPNFEAPADANADNVYDVTVQVSDGALTDTQAIAVTVTNVNEAPVIATNGGGATATVSLAENSTAVTTVAAGDPDAGASLSYAITGGADAALFQIAADTGALTFKSAPNFEAPADTNHDNVYDVTVQVSDGALTDTQAIAVTVTNVNEAPVIVSNGGGATATVSLAENTVAVATVAASDPDVGASLTYTIVGGADAALFQIIAGTGALSFKSAPNFEAPADANHDNVYDVTVQISDGALTDTQAIAVTVTNVAGMTITGTSGNDVITPTATVAGQPLPTAEEDKLIGNGGNDTLDGGAGNDVLTGNAGTDTFRVTSGIDSVTDLGSGGADVLVVSAGATANATIAAAWTATSATVNQGTAIITTAGLAVNLAAITSTTSGNLGYQVINTGTATTLTGSALGDRLTGGAGADTLSGGGGIDVLDGRDGADLYIIVAPAEHAAAEFADSGASGTDEVRFTGTTAGTLTLYAGDTGIERAVIGTGTTATAVTKGTTASNIDASALAYGITLVGNDGANVLAGGAGNDTLTGNGGVDTFRVSGGIDSVTDLGNGGADVLTIAAGATANATVTAAWTASAATANLGTANITTSGLAVNLAAASSVAGAQGYHVANTGAATTLTGSALDDWLAGGTAADTLNGGAGNDSLRGGLGNDSLTGGVGADTFVFDTTPNASSNKDTITDFTPGIDKLAFSKAAFAGLASASLGTLGVDAFWSGAGVTTAHDASDRLIYNTTTGALYYDADGQGGTAAVQVALLGTTSHPLVGYGDIHVIG